MDPINLLVAINLFITMSANFSGAKKGFKTSITKVIERPDTLLQKVPPNVAALVFLLIILSIFKIGTMPATFEQDYYILRITGLILFIFFSWIQIIAYKTLGNNYAQDIVIIKGQGLVKRGVYQFVRHPQYLSQLLSDFGAGLALMSYMVTPLVLFVEFPLFILRAITEEKMLKKHFGDDFIKYKKHSGFMIPFIG